jgi:hypothetical protein
MRLSTFSLSLLAAGLLLGSVSSALAEILGEGMHNKTEGKVVIEQVYRRNGIITIKGRGVCEDGNCDDHTYLHHSFLLDEERGVKYFPIRDDKGTRMASKNGLDFEGERFWVKYTAPPADIKEIDLYLENMEPIEALPITDK